MISTTNRSIFAAGPNSTGPMTIDEPHGSHFFGVLMLYVLIVCSCVASFVCGCLYGTAWTIKKLVEEERIK